MSQYVESKIIFHGDKKALKDIQNLITTVGNDSLKLNFSSVTDKVPGISNLFLYKLFGYDIFQSKKYTKEQEDSIDKKVNQLFKKEKWIGFRDSFINEAYEDCSLTLEKNSLTIHCSFKNQCPLDFFAYTANSFNTDLQAVTYNEVGITTVSYLDAKRQLQHIQNSHKAIIQNKLFRDLSIQLKLHVPADLMLTALSVGETSLAQEINNQYSIQESSFLVSIEELQDYLEQGWDIYNNSAFTGLSNIQDFNKEKLISQFKDIQKTPKNTLKKIAKK